MNKRALYEDNLFDGGVSIRDAPTSAEEGISESEDEVDADFIRYARCVGAAPQVDAINWDAPSPPARLIFHLPNRRDILESEGEPSPGTARPLNQHEQLIEDAGRSFSTDPEDPLSNAIDPEDESGQAAAGLLKGVIPLTQEGSALHASILAALEFHDSWLKQKQA